MLLQLTFKLSLYETVAIAPLYTLKQEMTISIQLSINYTIASYTATIFGIEQSESNQNSNGFLISQQVPYDLAIEENATFSITIVDENGLPNTITQNTLITSSQLPPDNIFSIRYLQLY